MLGSALRTSFSLSDLMIQKQRLSTICSLICLRTSFPSDLMIQMCGHSHGSRNGERSGEHHLGWIFIYIAGMKMFPILVPVHGTPFWAPRIEFRRLAWGCNTKHIQQVTRCVVHQSTIETPKLSIGIEISSSTWYPPVVGELNSVLRPEQKQRESAWIPAQHSTQLSSSQSTRIQSVKEINSTKILVDH